MSEDRVEQPSEWVELGKINGVFGVKGWVKVFSYTRQRDDILAYNPWFIETGNGWSPHQVLGGYLKGDNVVAAIEGYTDRDQARGLMGAIIAVPASQLPSTGSDEYYWRDLVGLEVVNTAQQVLGKVTELMETGANDVMILTGNRLVPFNHQTIKQVDLAKSRITVEWDIDD